MMQSAEYFRQTHTHAEHKYSIFVRDKSTRHDVINLLFHHLNNRNCVVNGGEEKANYGSIYWYRGAHKFTPY